MSVEFVNVIAGFHAKLWLIDGVLAYNCLNAGFSLATEKTNFGIYKHLPSHYFNSACSVISDHVLFPELQGPETTHVRTSGSFKLTNRVLVGAVIL